MGRNNEHISDETLLGFLLQALPMHEQQSIALLLSDDPDLAQRVRDLGDLLAPRDADATLDSIVESELPIDLTASTMALIANSNGHTGPAIQMTEPVMESSPATRLAWLDSFVALVAGIIILCVALPSVFVSRETARRISCASNLRELGQAIKSFAYGNAHRRVPNIDVNGPLSFAGIYPMRLKDAGLLTSPQHVWCPSIESIDLDQSIPTTTAFLSAGPSTQVNWRYTAGGNYSYHLGYVSNGRYVTPVIDASTNFALVGDTLLTDDSEIKTAPIHGRNAANILFADGQIRYVWIDQIDAAQVDHPYRNLDNEKAAGIGNNDCCLGPSHQFPLVPIKGR